MSAFLGAWASAVHLRNNLSSCRRNQSADYLSRGRDLPAQDLVRPCLIWDYMSPAPVAAVRCLGVQYMSMSNTSLNGAGEVIIDLTLLFGQWFAWHTDNLGMYREYVDDAFIEYFDGTAIGLSKNSSGGENVSDSSKGSMECVD